MRAQDALPSDKGEGLVSLPSPWPAQEVRAGPAEHSGEGRGRFSQGKWATSEMAHLLRTGLHQTMPQAIRAISCD